jgi:TPR repeat protein
MYYNGFGAGKDINNAIFWLKKAAEQGHKAAQHELEKLI